MAFLGKQTSLLRLQDQLVCGASMRSRLYSVSALERLAIIWDVAPLCGVPHWTPGSRFFLLYTPGSPVLQVQHLDRFILSFHFGKCCVRQQETHLPCSRTLRVPKLCDSSFGSGSRCDGDGLARGSDLPIYGH